MTLFRYPARSHAHQKQPIAVGLSSAVAALLALGFVLWMVYHAFQAIALHSLTRMESEFVAQTDALSSLMDTMVRNYGLQIFNSPAVSQLREDAQLSDWDKVYCLRELNTYVSNSDIVDSINVYNAATGFVYSTDPSLLSAPLDAFEDQTAVALFRASDSQNRMKPVRRTAFPGVPWREQEYYSFVFSQASPDHTAPGSALMFNIPYDWYVDRLLAFDDQSSCVLLNEAGGLIAYRSDTVARWAMHFRRAVVSAGLEEHESSYLIKKIGKKQVVCYYSRMESNHWYYLRIQTLDQSLPGLLDLRNHLAAWLSFGVVVLAVVAAVVMLRVFFPFRRIRLALRQTGTAVVSTEHQVTELVHSSLEYHQARILLNLLESRHVAPEKAPVPPFVLLLIQTDDTVSTHRAILERHPQALIHSQSGCEVVLLPESEQNEADALCRTLAEQFDCRCYCSSPRHRIAEIPDCYELLLEMQRQRYWQPWERLWREQNFAPRKAVSGFSDKDAALMVSVLRSGELEEGRRLWQELLGSIRNDSHRDQIFAISRTAQLLLKSIEELALPEEPMITDEYLNQLEDIDALTRRFDAAFVSIARIGAHKRRQRLSDIAAQISQRIDTGFEDSSLSPAVIADEMGLNSAYLGRLFRQSLNLSISDYINQVRIRNAAHMLAATSLSVESIAQRVGFGNVKYFFVIFKKLMGQTPLQYRKSRQISRAASDPLVSDKED